MSRQPQASFDFRGKYTQTSFATRRLLDGYFDSLGELIGPLELRRAVEIGCGEGFSTARLRAMLPPTTDFSASDVEDRLVQAAAAANPSVRVTKESIYDLPREDRSFDLVLVLEVLEHLDDPSRALAEACRISRRWVLASVPREPIWRVMNMMRGKYLRGMGNTPGHLQHWSRAAFVEFVGQAAQVRSVRTPLPWTMVLAEVR